MLQVKHKTTTLINSDCVIGRQILAIRSFHIDEHFKTALHSIPYHPSDHSSTRNNKYAAVIERLATQRCHQYHQHSNKDDL